MADALRQVVGADADLEKFQEPYRYDNIFHGSAWRLIPSQEANQTASSAEVLIAFKNEANATIGKTLHEKPLIMRVGHVYYGDALGFIHEDAPHLIKEA